METVADLFTALGRDRIRNELGHGQQVLSRAVSDNVMPAHWFFGLRDLCDRQGIACPEHLFRVRKPASAATTSETAA